jgi:predicted nucleotidyltransferase
MVSQDNIRTIVDTIVMTYQPDKIMLFGSYATGQPTEDSDVDLLIVKDTDLPRHQRGREVRQYLYGSKFPMDIIVATPHELEQSQLKPYSFLYQALHSSKTVYER